MEEESKNPIQAAEKLFRVIELLAENGPMGIMELSASLGFHKCTVHRLVASYSIWAISARTRNP